jgi:hypothetical protein
MLLEDVSKDLASCILNGQKSSDIGSASLPCSALFYAALHCTALRCSALSVSVIVRYVRTSDSVGSSMKMQECVIIAVRNVIARTSSAQLNSRPVKST